jgi:hypothetical protein
LTDNVPRILPMPIMDVSDGVKSDIRMAYTIDTPSVGIDEEYAHSADPAVASIRGHVFDMSNILKWFWRAALRKCPALRFSQVVSPQEYCQLNSSR